jgi:hypothetical protein
MAPDDETSDAGIRDELPEDLNAAEFVGPYMFPNNNRRRIPGALYVLLGLGAVALWAATRNNDPVLVNAGFLWGGVALVLFGIYSYQAGFDLDVDERDALAAAGHTVDFPVGHASAQLGWRGLRSRPTWRILLYSSEEPPAKRGLVLVDGVKGDVLQHFVEDNPEDWTDKP